MLLLRMRSHLRLSALESRKVRLPGKHLRWNSSLAVMKGKHLQQFQLSGRLSYLCWSSRCAFFCVFPGSLLASDHSVKLSIAAAAGSPIVLDIYIAATYLQHLRGLLPGAKILFQNLERKISRYPEPCSAPGLNLTSLTVFETISLLLWDYPLSTPA